MDINLPSTTPIRTRGDVLIRKNGNVNTSEVRCRDLKVHGRDAFEFYTDKKVTISRWF